MTADGENVLTDVQLFPYASYHIGQTNKHVDLICTCQLSARWSATHRNFASQEPKLSPLSYFILIQTTQQDLGLANVTRKWEIGLPVAKKFPTSI